MKIRSLTALVGLAISFALPTFAQQTNTSDPQLRQRLVALIKQHTDALDKNDASWSTKRQYSASVTYSNVRTVPRRCPVRTVNCG